MKLGIYMGSFNPPHQGHLSVINYLLDNNVVDKILIVPTLNYWDKDNLVDIKDRINMLKYWENNHIIVDDTNNKYIYTYELLQVLSQKYPNDTLYPIMGADNILSFDKWKNYQDILKYKIIVMNRNNIDIKKYLNKFGLEHFMVFKDYPFINISSTEIRKKLNSKYLDKKIREYIEKNHLYEN